MKKLMFAALAVVSCSAFAAKDVQVNDLTLTKKALAYATKSYTIKIVGTDWTNAEQNVAAEFAKITNNIVKACTYDIDYELPEITDAWAAIDKSGKVKGTIKFTAPAVDNKGFAKTKVVTTKLNGFAITRGKETKTYLWDNTKNEYAKDGFKFWACEIPGAKFRKELGTADGKAQLGLEIANDEGHTLQAVATGTYDKNAKAIKSVAGNFADIGCMGYGTWKFALNKSVTTKAIDDASGVNSNEDILKLKKVELRK